MGLDATATWTTLQGEGKCEDDDGRFPAYYTKVIAPGSAAVVCQNECCKLDACVAYTLSTVDGGCAILGKGLVKGAPMQPVGWQYGKSSGGSNAITSLTPAPGYNCVVKPTGDATVAGLRVHAAAVKRAP